MLSVCNLILYIVNIISTLIQELHFINALDFYELVGIVYWNSLIGCFSLVEWDHYSYIPHNMSLKLKFICYKYAEHGLIWGFIRTTKVLLTREEQDLITNYRLN